MRPRRYREKNAVPCLLVHGKTSRIHDFLRGWGTINSDGSILWDTWRPLSKKKLAKLKKSLDRGFQSVKLPMVALEAPTLSVDDILGVQPLYSKVADHG